MRYATPVQPKIGTDKIIQRYTHSTWFFHALRKWFQRFTPAQPEIFAKISLYTTVAQLDFHYNLISVSYTCTTWNLYLYGKITYFMLHSLTLIFITFAKHDFRGFFILAVCFLTYTYFVLTFISKLSRFQAQIQRFKEVSQTDQVPGFPLAAAWISRSSSVIICVELSTLIHRLGAHQCKISWRLQWKTSIP